MAAGSAHDPDAYAEFQAAEKLVQAGAMISAQPIALQLRFLQTMKEISGQSNTTTFLPLPMELFTPFMRRAREAEATKAEPAAAAAIAPAWRTACVRLVSR